MADARAPTAHTAHTALAAARADIHFRAAVGALLSVSAYTSADPVLADPPYLLDLIRSDATAPRATGTPPTADEYAALFPAHAAAIRGLFVSNATTGSLPADSESADEFSFLGPPLVPGDLGRLADFRIIRVLAEGGMGVVFEGYDLLAARRVAVKVIRPGKARTPGARTRFLKEARAAAQLDHPNVLKLHHVGVAGETLFQVTPLLLKGSTLATRLAQTRTLGAGEVVRLARDAAAGLAAASRAGLVHRDIKPSNLWLEPDGDGWKTLVLDFGLVLDPADDPLTPDGVVLGTVPYMSPEQGKSIDRPTDPRSDLFSLGVVLYEAATGKRVFDHKDTAATMRATAEYHPPPLRTVRPDLPPAAADLFDRLLAKEPAGRPASADAVLAELDRLGLSRPPGPLPSTIAATPRPPRRPWQIPVAAVVACGLIVTAVKFWPRSGEGPPPTPPTGSLSAVVDVDFVAGPGRTFRGGLRDPFTLPARPGDQVRMTVRASAPAYVYVFAITSGATVYPLYPWRNSRWDSRPAAETPTAFVLVPPDNPDLSPKEVNAMRIGGSKTGMESVLAVLRTDPWAAPDADIKGLFAGLEAEYGVPTEKTFVTYDNGVPVLTDERTRDFDPAHPTAASQVQIQNLIARRLQPHAAFTTAVSFAKVDR